MKNSTNGFVVVVDNSWYVGFIPFYIYFALRACPDAKVFIYLRGKLDNKIQKQIEILSPKGQWSIFENYKIDYPDNPFTTKSLRWTILYDVNLMPKNLYIGDVDIMVRVEKPSLFEQHSVHSSVINLPYSNIIRGKLKRISGLHFIKTHEYMECMCDTIEKYDQLLKEGNIRRKRNEHFLFDMLNEVNLLPEDGVSEPYGYTPKQLNFRPHHGIHLGFFRGKRFSGKLPIQYSESIQYLEYLIDFWNAFEENSKLFDAVNESNCKIKQVFNRAILFAERKKNECIHKHR